ncbi:MAG: hypothetical protein IKP28_04415 [Clostridia bacterium]|nr:hypothetical protein [Clostridia bacterium]
MNTKKGITLIALVITVIILLILAAVIISLGLDSEGLFAKTNSAVTGWNRKVEMEESSLHNWLALANEIDEDIVIPEGAVARIGIDFFPTLQEAINSITSNTLTTVLLLKDINENVTVPQNRNVILDLDGKEITNATNTPIITLSGNMTVKNGTIMGQYGAKAATILVNQNSKINVINTIIGRESEGSYSWETVQLYGDLDISSGKISSTNSNAICVYNGYVNINISGTAEISGESANNTTIDNNGGSIVINGGKVSTTNRPAIHNYSNGTVEISGTAEVTAMPDGDIPVYNQNGTLILSGGKVSGPYGAIYNDSNGTLEISGSTQAISSGSYIVLTNYGTASLLGGEIGGSNVSIWNYSGATMEIGGSTDIEVLVNAGSATLTGGMVGRVQNNKTGTINVSGTVEITDTFDNSGTVTATGGKFYGGNYNNVTSIFNSATGTIEISGTAEVLQRYSAIAFDNTGTAILKGGIINSSGGGLAIRNTSNGTVYLGQNCVVTGNTSGIISPYNGE